MENLREQQLQEVALRKKELMEKYGLTEKAFSLTKWRKNKHFAKLIRILKKSIMPSSTTLPLTCLSKVYPFFSLVNIQKNGKTKGLVVMMTIWLMCVI